MFLLISYRFLSRESSDSVPPPMSSWYVSPIRRPRSTRSSSTFLCRIVDPIWSITSSPASGIFFFRYFDCHALFEAIRAGVALMKALLDCRAAWAYIWLAFDAPVGVRFTNISDFDSVRVLAVLLGLESLTC